MQSRFAAADKRPDKNWDVDMVSQLEEYLTDQGDFGRSFNEKSHTSVLPAPPWYRDYCCTICWKKNAGRKYDECWMEI